MSVENSDDLFGNLLVEDPDNENLKWYLLQTQSNCEKKASSNIKVELELTNMQNLVKEILIPSVEVVEMTKGGKKRKVQKKLYPNYILVFADMNEDLCSKISNTSKVLGFLNKTASSLLPRPLPNKEVESIFEKLKIVAGQKQSLISIQEGSVVLIKEKPFEGFEGRVKSLSDDLSVATVVLTILGRDTEININIKNLEKVSS